jgi:alkanesulfonate monooxygenase SsuD/methylene tetrahydromethanopterin reductase-like flavin-dependent oxidoreductase (luciferase family)
MPILARTEREARQRADSLSARHKGPSPFFVGTPAGLAEELENWIEAGACDGFDLRPAVNMSDLELIIEAVAPSLHRTSSRSSNSRSTLRQDLQIPRPV